MIRNSWGENWGARGNLYVPVGMNSYCTEMYAYAAVPEKADFTKLADRGKRVRGFFKLTHLDPDLKKTVKNDGSFSGMKESLSYNARIAVVVAVCVIIVAIVVGIVCCCRCCCKNSKKRKES